MSWISLRQKGFETRHSTLLAFSLYSSAWFQIFLELCIFLSAQFYLKKGISQGILEKIRIEFGITLIPLGYPKIFFLSIQLVFLLIKGHRDTFVWCMVSSQYPTCVEGCLKRMFCFGLVYSVLFKFGTMQEHVFRDILHIFCMSQCYFLGYDNILKVWARGYPMLDIRVIGIWFMFSCSKFV